MSVAPLAFLILSDLAFIPDVPLGEQPPRALNLNVSEEAGGWVLRWEGSNETLANNRTKVLYYTVEKRKDKDGEPWQRLAEYIHVEEASYMSKSNNSLKMSKNVSIYFYFFSEKHGCCQSLFVPSAQS